MIAEVIVDISSSEVDRVFDYKVSELKDIKRGSRVGVPFGNREIEGYVVGFKEESDVPDSKLKDIVRLIDDYPVITEEMFELMSFMRKKYRLRIVDVLRLFIPSQMRGGRVKELKKQYVSVRDEFINADIDTFIKPAAKAQRDVYYHLCDVGSASLTEMNENFSASAVRNLITRDILRVDSVEIKRTPYKELKDGVFETRVLTEIGRAHV